MSNNTARIDSKKISIARDSGRATEIQRAMQSERTDDILQGNPPFYDQAGLDDREEGLKIVAGR